MDLDDSNNDKENDYVLGRYQSLKQYHTLWKMLSSDPSVQAEIQSFRLHEHSDEEYNMKINTIDVDHQDLQMVPNRVLDFMSAIENKTNVAFQVNCCLSIDCQGCVDPIIEDEEAEDGKEHSRRYSSRTTLTPQSLESSISRRSTDGPLNALFTTPSPVSSSSSGGSTVVAFDISHLRIDNESDVDSDGDNNEASNKSKHLSVKNIENGGNLDLSLSRLTIHGTKNDSLNGHVSPGRNSITKLDDRKGIMKDVDGSPRFSEDSSFHSSSSGGSTVVKFVMDSKSFLEDYKQEDIIQRRYSSSPKDDTSKSYRVLCHDNKEKLCNTNIDVSDSEAEWVDSDYLVEDDDENNDAQDDTIIIVDDDDDLIEYESDASSKSSSENIIHLDEDSDVCSQDDFEPIADQNKTSQRFKLSSSKKKINFKRNREAITFTTKNWFDEKVFAGKLRSVDVTYVPRLTSTAGLTRLKTRTVNGVVSRIASIELSSKLIDDEGRLRSTLMHELCHAAAFLVDGVSKPPHGECFRKWSKHAMKTIPEILVTTTHSYSTNTHKYAWECTNENCSVVIKRHSKSVKVDKHVCGKCKSKLIEIEVPKPGDSSLLRMPKKKKQPSGFSLYVQQNSSSVRKRLERESKKGTVEQKEVMKELGIMWRALKLG